VKFFIMGHIIFTLFSTCFAGTDTPIVPLTKPLGNPLDRLQYAVTQLPDYYPVQGLLTVETFDRVKLYAGSLGSCSPVAWRYQFAPLNVDQKHPLSSAIITIYESEYPNLQDLTKPGRCVPTAEFEIDGKNYPYGTGPITLNSEELKNVFSLDEAVKIAKSKGVIVIRKISIYDYSESGLRYEFFGEDSTGKSTEAVISAKDGSVIYPK
jgi:hypothetical protein